MQGKSNILYRMYSDDGILLYVGLTCNLPGRFKKHKAEKDWFVSVSDIRLEHFDTREELVRAERDAIVSERPRFNVMHNARAAAGNRIVGNFDAIGEDETCGCGQCCPICWLDCCATSDDREFFADMSRGNNEYRIHSCSGSAFHMSELWPALSI